MLQTQINSNDVHDVRYFSGELFCVTGQIDEGNVMIQVYSTNNWIEPIRLIESPCGCMFIALHTLHVGSEYITLACRETNIIYTMSHIGEPVHTTQRGEGLGEFDYPVLCHTGSNAVLVADFWNHRIQLCHEGRWSRALLKPQPPCPIDVVYAGGILYVLSGPFDDIKIVKYVLMQ